MHNETCSNDFKQALKCEDVTEDCTDELKRLVVLSLIITVAIVSTCEYQRVEEDGKYDECLESITMCDAYNPLTDFYSVVENVKRAMIVYDDALLGWEV